MVEDYLKIIWKAEEWPTGSVSTSEIASILAVTPSSVSANLKKLGRDGLIEYQPYGSIRLTASGRAIAVRVVRRHRVLEAYLVERLGFGWDEVHQEADALEHAVSDVVLDRMDEVLGYPERDPHGDLIPRVDGSVERAPATQLSELDLGDEGRVIRISDHDPAILRYLEDRQIAIGTVLRVAGRSPSAGSLSVALPSGGRKLGDLLEIASGAAEAVWVDTESVDVATGDQQTS